MHRDAWMRGVLGSGAMDTRIGKWLGDGTCEDGTIGDNCSTLEPTR